jgi:hypothetical protein
MAAEKLDLPGKTFDYIILSDLAGYMSRKQSVQANATELKSLEQRINERRNCRTLRENDQPANDQQHQDHRRHPPPLALPEERQQIAEDPHPFYKVLEKTHCTLLAATLPLSFSTT